jgi:hypothetical protein
MESLCTPACKVSGWFGWLPHRISVNEFPQISSEIVPDILVFLTQAPCATSMKARNKKLNEFFMSTELYNKL